jgi:hypothetical protein
MCDRSPIAASIRSSNLPDRPTKGRPSMSSSRPGASPTNISRACGLPSAKTSWVAVALRAQPSNRSSTARSSSSVAARFAMSRAAMAASSGAGGATGEGVPAQIRPALWPDSGRVRARPRPRPQIDRPASRQQARRHLPRYRNQADRAPNFRDRGPFMHISMEVSRLPPHVQK